jgi:hypothetical protein
VEIEIWEELLKPQKRELRFRTQKKNRSGIAGAVDETMETLAGTADYIFK